MHLKHLCTQERLLQCVCSRALLCAGNRTSLSHHAVHIIILLVPSCQLQHSRGVVCRCMPLHSWPQLALSSLQCPPLQHSGPLTPAQLALSANTLQNTVSMRHEGLAVSPIDNQRHVGSLAMVSACQMWLGNACATCLGSHSLGTARTQWQAAVFSALACKLSRYEFTHIHIHAPQSRA